MTHVCLGDVAREIKQKVPAGQELPTVGLEHLDPGEVELAHWDEGAETTFTKAFSKGQVLFGRRRAYLRKAAVAPFDGICSGDIIVIAPKDNLSPRLLPFIIQNDALFEHAVTNSAGSLSPRVKWQSLSQFEFELPSIAKQEDLADILWTAQETRSHYRQLLTACDDVVKSQFVEMFGEPAENPKGWETSSLTSLGSCKNGMNFKSKESGIELPCLGVGDFKDRSVINDVSEMGRINLDDEPAEGYFLKDGDIVFVRSNGNKELVGRCLAVYSHGEKAVFSGFCIRLRVESDKVRIPYLIWALKQPSMRQQMFGRGANVQNLNQKLMAKVDVPIPPLAEQDRFLALVSIVDKSKFAVQQALDELNATTKKILNQELGLGDV